MSTFGFFCFLPLSKLRRTFLAICLMFGVVLSIPAQAQIYNLQPCTHTLTVGDVQQVSALQYAPPCAFSDWNQGDMILLKSAPQEVIGVFELQEGSLRVVSVRQDRLIQKTNYFERLDIDDADAELNGTTYLWKVRKLPSTTRPKFRPLYTQGATIGETAQTLSRGEYYASVFGDLGYGFRDSLSVNTNLVGFALGSPNAKVKGRVYRSSLQTWAVSMSTAQERNSSEKLFNIDVIWDSILSEKLVAHSIISAAVVSFDSAKDVTALKSYGSSSIQTGYEYLFSDWSRLLIGPSYNLDKKAIGGYIAYVKIFDNFHLQGSITTTNIREMKFSAEEGYFFLLDAYWRW